MTESSKIALALHGGGGKAGRDYGEAEAHLLETCAAGEGMLRQGARAVDVVEAMCVAMEDSGLYVAGRGSGPNLAGYVEVDASIMVCDPSEEDPRRSRRAGAVAAVALLENPVRAARAVMEETPHILLAGTGAENFCRSRGFAFIEDPDSYYVTPVGLTREELWSSGHGTVGAAALDSYGCLAAASSTGGTLGKQEGRVGDTPLIGAGTWADENLAASVTGIGEMDLLAGGLHSIAGQVRYGDVEIPIAASRFVADVGRLGGEAGVIVVSRSGDIAFAWHMAGMKRAGVGPNQPLFSATF